MAYNELIKDFSKIRDYIREFYVYGFKSRDEFTKKSGRSYDDERRRIESWLGEYMSFRNMPDGKNIFISLDSREVRHNPLYKAWKSKSFTDGDISLHFLIFDILYSDDLSLTLNNIMDEIDERLSVFQNPKTFDISTVRKKLKEYVDDGIIVAKKDGKTMVYSRTFSPEISCNDALNFFSETAPCSVIGSFLLDKINENNQYFTFKHHYITDAIDSDILYSLFIAISKRIFINIQHLNHNKESVLINDIAPLKIYISVQNGRQYLMGYVLKSKKISSFRLDNILSLKYGDYCENFENYINILENKKKNFWGVSNKNSWNKTEHIDFTIKYDDNEQYIHSRLEREKRCGNVVKIDNNTSRFSADVYDSLELIPWIRTFICRIIDINFSNENIKERFFKDINNMYDMYGI